MAHTSAEGSSSSNTYMWLSDGRPRKYYNCSLCHMSFKSMNALGGHQNAHRRHRNQMQKFMNSKRKTYYEFIPVRQGNTGIYGYGRRFQNPLNRLASFAANWVPSHATMLNTRELDLSLKL